jgi:hypothetical protein
MKLTLSIHDISSSSPHQAFSCSGLFTVFSIEVGDDSYSSDQESPQPPANVEN